MNRTKSPTARVVQAIATLVLVSLACSLGDNTDVIQSPVPPTQVPQLPTDTAAPDLPTATPGLQPVQPTGVGLSTGQRQHLAAATVLIIMAEVEGGDFYPFGIGSGTVLSADGLILTNAHVARPSAGGFGEDPDALIIALNKNESSPPAPTYLAEVLAVDGFLDLAVIKITSNLDGSFVNAGSLGLPYVDIGNSDDMHLGDSVNIFGFPGIGGDTITFTKGSVAGFSSQDPIGDRAWIKTDATIAGGNSGGLGANDFAQIIGVPTRGGAGTDTSITDCRVVQDTNGDGRLDQNDTCIPIGGFINALRPINLAVPLIRSAQTGTAYVSPYDAGGGGIAGTGNERMTFLHFSTYFDENTVCGVNPATSFPSGVDQLTASFSYAGLTDGQDFGLYWLIDGDVAVDNLFAWDGGPSGECYVFYVHNGGDALPDGQYTLLLFAGDELPQIAEATTTVGGGGGGGVAPPPGGAVSVDGFIWDADTGNPIAEAVIVILKPGLDADAWLVNGTDDDVFTWTSTDANGFFILPDALQRGVEYPALAGASSQGYLTTTGFFLLTDDDPDAITINIELNK
ncbi:MAG TPA: serine protease [Anaerolineales bacterium]|nr:serine protease [Anaerolineales bacterium]